MRREFEPTSVTLAIVALSLPVSGKCFYDPDSAAAAVRFTLAFLDPPYGKGLASSALIALRDGGWLDKDALVLVEEAAQAEITLPEDFTRIEARSYGDTQVVFIRAA